MVISVFNIVKIGVVVPAAISSLWLFKPGMHSPTPSTGVVQAQNASVGATREFYLEGVATAPLANDHDQVLAIGSGSVSELNTAPTDRSNNEIVYQRRERVEHILGALNRINEVSMQMDPDRAATLEPVLMDIAEETMALSDRSTIVKPTTDEDLGRIEATVKKLSHAVARSIEPEMSL